MIQCFQKQSGTTLSEVLISLFLASIIMTILIQLYLSSKQHYLEAEQILESNFDLQWVSDLLSDSIRRAGFTPCLGIDQLQVVDRRDIRRTVKGLKIENEPQQLIQVNRMSEVFAKVLYMQSPTKIVVPHSILFNEQRPLLIADCEHAEVHQIFSIEKQADGYLITLTKPLFFSYPESVYIGEWLEEQWFIKKNTEGTNTLHYQLVQIEELSPLVHSLKMSSSRVHGKQFLKVILGMDKDKTHQLTVAVRGS